MGDTRRVDLRISKMIPIFNVTKLTVFLSILNLFDSLNPVNVWSVTGDPWDAGPASSRTLDRQRNPDNVSLRRSFQLGVRLDF